MVEVERTEVLMREDERELKWDTYLLLLVVVVADGVQRLTKCKESEVQSQKSNDADGS